jgi:predicted metal-dependent hydrolase
MESSPLAAVHFPAEAEEGVRLFNQRQYFEAHDVLEEIWIGRTGSEKIFYQGLIQVAVGLYKIAVGNQGGAVSLLTKGLDKLHATRDLNTPLDLERLIQETETVLARVKELGQGRIGDFDPSEAPQIHWRPDRAIARPS